MSMFVKSTDSQMCFSYRKTTPSGASGQGLRGLPSPHLDRSPWTSSIRLDQDQREHFALPLDAHRPRGLRAFAALPLEPETRRRDPRVGRREQNAE